MKTFLKWILRIVVVIAVLLVVIPVGATLYFDQDDIKSRVDSIVFDATGRHLEVAGPIGFTPGLDLSVYAEDVRYENAEWARDKPAVSARRLSAELSLAALLRGKVRVDEVTLDGFELLIESNESGQINLVEPSDAAPTEPGPIAVPEWIEIGEIRITDSRLVSISDNPDFIVGIQRLDLVNDGRVEPLQLDARVSLQDMALAITGSPGSLDNWLQRERSETSLSIAVGDSGTVKADGTVGDLLAWKDVDLLLDASLPSLDPLSSLLPSPPPAVADIRTTTRLVQPGAADTMGLQDLVSSVSFAGLEIAAKGSIERLIKATGINLAVTASGRVDQSMLPEAVPETLAPVVDVAATVTGSGQAPGIRISEAKVMLGDATLTATGEVANALGSWDQPVVISLDVPDAVALGDQLGFKLPAVGGITGTAGLTSVDGNFGLRDINIKTRDSDAAATVSGGIEGLLAERRGELNIKALVQPGFFAASGYEIPVSPGPVDAKAVLKLDGESMQLVLNQASTSLPGMTVTASGGIPDLGQPTTMSINLDGKVESLTQLGQSFDASLPDLGPLPFSAVLDGSSNQWSLNKISLKGDDSKLRLDVSGQIANLGPELVADIKVNGNVKQLAAIGREFDVELPEISPLDLQATVAASDSKWHLQDLKVTTDNDGLALTANGSLRNLGPDLIAEIVVDGTLGIDRATRLVPAIAESINPIKDELAPIRADAKIVAASASAWSIETLDVKSQWLGADLGVNGAIDGFTPLEGNLDVSMKGATNGQTALLQNYPLPVLDDIDISLTVPLPVADNGIRNIKGKVAAGSALLKLDGDIRQLSPLSGEGFNLVLEADDLATLIADDKVFKPGNAVKVDVDVALDPGEFTANGKVRVGDSDLDAVASWTSRPDQLPKLEAKIKATRVDLVSLLQESKQTEEVKPKDKSTHLVPTESLVPDGADRLEADIRLDVEKLITRAVNLDGVGGNLLVQDGKITSDLVARNGDGQIELDVSLKKGARNSLNARVVDFPLDAIRAISESKLLVGGTMDFGFNLDAASDSLSGMLANGEGAVGLDIYEAQMKNTALGLVGGDLLTNVLAVVNPFAERSDSTGVECAAFHLDIGGGKISTENGIAMKTDKVTLLGGGEIDFPSESLRLVIAPKARTGLGVSATSVAKMVRVGGTLSSPSVEADAKGLLKSGAAIGAALASGGLSLFATGLLDKFKANSEVCAIARGDKKRPQVRKSVNEQASK